ncbi:LAGLIDADG family homing endonuclease [Thermococcus sp.]|uniref:LAGLIDADG family homing endonuclease n=1 Tax=Thermococcus sp. TaxID=35749 RepID=UPI0026241978|nr:LAGLIDADG family homing endonuclease [Thermococcus sp.]
MRTLRELSQSEIEVIQKRVEELRQNGLSYREISEQIGREFNLRISKATVLRWCKGTNNTFNKTKKVLLSPSPELAYIVGAYFGDASATEGSNYRYKVKLKVIDREFAEAFARALSRIGLNPRMGFENDRTRTGRWYVEVTSKGLFRFLTGPREGLFEVAKAYPREFLRGFFDSEGSVVVSKGRVKVLASNYDIEVLRLCQNLLEVLGIHSKIYKTKHKGQPVVIRGKQYRYNSDLFTLTINRKESVYRYTREVGFSIPRKQNKLLSYFGLL